MQNFKEYINEYSLDDAKKAFSEPIDKGIKSKKLFDNSDMKSFIRKLKKIAVDDEAYIIYIKGKENKDISISSTTKNIESFNYYKKTSDSGDLKHRFSGRSEGTIKFDNSKKLVVYSVIPAISGITFYEIRKK